MLKMNSYPLRIILNNNNKKRKGFKRILVNIKKIKAYKYLIYRRILLIEHIKNPNKLAIKNA